MSDRGLSLALSIADDKLEAMEDYFDNRADVDCDPTPQSNTEMRLLMDVKWLRWTLKRIAEAKPIPTAHYYLAGRVPE